MLALNILDKTIRQRWQILPQAQRDGIKTYIVNLIIRLSSDAATLKAQSTFLTKLNGVLIQIVKQEWPHNWPSFIPELVNSSKSSQSLCANNMNILKLLSEEVFDYGSTQMTQDKMKSMKSNLNREFTLIFQLCEYILDNSQDATLLSVTLQTLLRFLHWIPVGYIFETKLIQTLAVKFFPVAIFQNDTLQCLSEIGALKLEDTKYNTQFIQLYFAVISQVSKLLTPETDVAKVYAAGGDIAQEFVRHLTLFVTGFLKSHLSLLESYDDSTRHALYTSLTFLLRISRVDDPTIFKMCLEYWNILVTDLYATQRQFMARPPLLLGKLTATVARSAVTRVDLLSTLLTFCLAHVCFARRFFRRSHQVSSLAVVW